MSLFSVIDFEFWLTNGGDPDYATPRGETGLLIASRECKPELVKILLSYGAEVNLASSNGTTPLLMASMYCLEIARILLKGRASVNVTTDEGVTPLMATAQEGNVEIMTELLAAGANVNQDTMSCTTPLSIASTYGRSRIVETLLTAGAAVNHVTYECCPSRLVLRESCCIELVPSDPVVFGGQLTNASTPLLAASQNGHTETALLLVDAGAEVNKFACEIGITPLMFATLRGHNDTALALVTKGAAVNQNTNDGMTPLSIACIIGDIDLASILITAGAAVNQPSHDGKTPLHRASTTNNSKLASVLLTAKAAVNQCTFTSGDTPLIMACMGGHTKTVSILLAAGADVNQLTTDDRIGVDASVVACQMGFLDIVKLLSSYSPKRSSTTLLRLAEDAGHSALAAWLVLSQQWNTPLHHLVTLTDDNALARTLDLLRNGADILAASTPNGPTPLSLAKDAADEGSAAWLVLRAAAPWNPKIHNLFPEAARERAVQMLLLGHLLSQQKRFSGQEVAIFDIWMQNIVPQLVRRTQDQACVSL